MLIMLSSLACTTLVEFKTVYNINNTACTAKLFLTGLSVYRTPLVPLFWSRWVHCSFHYNYLYCYLPLYKTQTKGSYRS